MKQIILFFILLFCTCDLFAQITITSTPEPKLEINNAPYDSTKNYLGENLHQYIGQVLYLKEKHEMQREYGYDGFVLDYNVSSIGLIGQDNVYKCCDSYNSKYSDLAGLYFDVLDVHKHPKSNEDEFLYGSIYFLELREQTSGDKVYFKYSTESEYSFPFIVVGYFEKFKELNLGQKFVVRGRNWRDSRPTITDIRTGEPVTLIPGSVWEIVDLTIEDTFYTIVFLIQNEKSETIPITPSFADDKRFVFKYEDAKLYEEKFGTEDWNTILNARIEVGFTEEMAVLAWGEPETINRSSQGRDQWVYNGQYLYIENGEIVAWN